MVMAEMVAAIVVVVVVVVVSDSHRKTKVTERRSLRRWKECWRERPPQTKERIQIENGARALEPAQPEITEILRHPIKLGKYHVVVSAKDAGVPSEDSGRQPSASLEAPAARGLPA